MMPLYPLFRYVNQRLLALVMRKHKSLRAHKVRASNLLQKVKQGEFGPVRALADWHDRHGCLMGAQ